MKSLAVFFSTAVMLVGALVQPAPGLAQRNLSYMDSRNPASPEKRLALVIGNGAYETAFLRNPLNDATDMAEALRVIGFKVETVINGNRKTMEEAIRAFGKELRTGGVGLFYFAGHGLQVNGRNYLIPVGANIETEADVEFEAVDAGRVLSRMEEAGNEVNVVILDACRNNPFARSFRSAQNGLARMDAPKGSLIVYATAPGSVAADGEGRNGVYTKHLLNTIKVTGLSIEEVLKKVRIQVLEETNGKQVPWESSSLTGYFYFNRPVTIQITPPGEGTSQPSMDKTFTDAAFELKFWESVEKNGKAQDYQTYLETYPQGRFASLAKSRIEELKTRIEKPKPRPAAPNKFKEAYVLTIFTCV